jgi:hypothetical protein
MPLRAASRAARLHVYMLKTCSPDQLRNVILHGLWLCRGGMRQTVSPKEGCSAAGGCLIMCALWDWIHKDVALPAFGMDRVVAARCCVAYLLSKRASVWSWQ